MAGQPRNLEKVSQGSTITLDASFRLFKGGPLVSTDDPPKYEIYNPNSVLVFSGIAVEIDTGNYIATYEVANDALISDRWRIVWKAKINGKVVPDGSEFFSVVEPGTIIFDEITINTDDLNLIKKVLGFPQVEEILLTDEQIRDLCVWPALQEYFTKFPIKVPAHYEIDQELTLPFPDHRTYGVSHCGVTGKRFRGSGKGSSFWDLVFYNKYSPVGGLSTSYNRNRGFGRRSMGYNPNGLRQATENYDMVLDSYGNKATFKYRLEKLPEGKKLIAYSSVSAYLDVIWAKYSKNFDDVDFPRRMEVIRLAQAELLYHFADSTGISEDGNSEQTLNSEALKARADELRESVISRWSEWPDTLIIRAT